MTRVNHQTWHVGLFDLPSEAWLNMTRAFDVYWTLPPSCSMSLIYRQPSSVLPITVRGSPPLDSSPSRSGSEALDSREGSTTCSSGGQIAGNRSGETWLANR